MSLAVSSCSSVWFSVLMLIDAFFSSFYGHHRHLHSFPTRRSSDLAPSRCRTRFLSSIPTTRSFVLLIVPMAIDRKSTRLNSSHTVTSYAVFCWKKKISVGSQSRIPAELVSSTMQKVSDGFPCYGDD